MFLFVSFGVVFLQFLSFTNQGEEKYKSLGSMEDGNHKESITNVNDTQAIMVISEIEKAGLQMLQ